MIADVKTTGVNNFLLGKNSVHRARHFRPDQNDSSERHDWQDSEEEECDKKENGQRQMVYPVMNQNLEGRSKMLLHDNNLLQRNSIIQSMNQTLLDNSFANSRIRSPGMSFVAPGHGSTIFDIKQKRLGPAGSDKDNTSPDSQDEDKKILKKQDMVSRIFSKRKPRGDVRHENYNAAYGQRRWKELSGGMSPRSKLRSRGDTKDYQILISPISQR